MTKLWHRRQKYCEDWYQTFSREDRRAMLSVDYGPHRSTLEKLDGCVLDVGGGCGFAADYLPRASKYVVLDPSYIWLQADWSHWCDKPVLRIIGFGEQMPFASSTFDFVLSMWSINHAQRPQEMCLEMARVLKPRGIVILILEEAQPRWSDLLRREFIAMGLRTALKQTIVHKLLYPLMRKPWPIGEDHIYVPEGQLIRWFSMNSCQVAEREWRGGYLCFQFQKTYAPSKNKL